MTSIAFTTILSMASPSTVVSSSATTTNVSSASWAKVLEMGDERIMTLS